MTAPRLVHTFIVFLCLAALWLAGLFWFTRSITAMPEASETQKADAIVVLTGGSNRISTGFRLLQEGMGGKLFISGVYRGVEAQELLDLWTDEMKSGLDCCVALGFEADNTIGNARETAAWAAREGVSSILLVTANYHMKRAMLEFKMAAPALDAIPYAVAPDKLDMRNWWRNAAFRSLIIGEYSKYLVTLLRYGITV